MRQVIICVVLALLGGASASSLYEYDKEPYAFEGTINSTIEGFRPSIPEPIEIANLSIAMPPEIDVITGTADLSNLILSGIHDFQVTALNFAIVGMRLNFTFVLPVINLNTDYWADLNLLDLVPIYGNGKANIHIEDVQIQGSAQANLAGGISVKDLRIQLYIGPSTFDIHGALDNEDFSIILSELLNDVVTSFIDNHQPVISNIISPIIEELLNSILAGTSTDTTTIGTAAP